MRRFAAVPLVLVVLILFGNAGSGTEPRLVPDVERWKPCEVRTVYPFFAMVYCAKPDGSGEIGAHAYHVTKNGRVFLGKAWGMRKIWGGLRGLDYTDIQAMMLLEDGRTFFGARGAQPEFVPILDVSGVETIGLRIRLRGPDGAYAERVIMRDAR